MKTTYAKMKKDQQDRHDNFEGIFFAFSNKQFTEGMTKIGLKAEEGSKVSRLGNTGGVILKDRVKAYRDMITKNVSEMELALKDQAFLLGALIYELGNHEYCYTGRASDALDALDLKAEDIPPEIFNKALNAASEE